MIDAGAGWIGLTWGEEESGAGDTGTSTLPIGIDTAPKDTSGITILINPFRGGTASLALGIGPYSTATTLPITINPRFAGTSTLPIGILGDLSSVAAADFVQWAPVVWLNGVNISAKVVGQIQVDFAEGAASTAEVSYLPAAGAIDPLALCNKPITITWTQTGGERLMFTGKVSDPSWSPDDRLMTLSCSGELQQRLDGMTKAAIRSQFPDGVWSDMVFGPEGDAGGWDYAQDLLSTTDQVVWQDAAGSIRSSSIYAKASADFTFTDDSRFSNTLALQFAQRSDMVNEVAIRTDYRYNRRRERTIKVSWSPRTMTTCLWLLQGFELPQRTMIESAANSGGWVVLGDIKYTPVWPGSAYPCMGSGESVYFVNNPVITAEWCIAAWWNAARRWMQTVTEQHALVVRATDSVTAAGKLATSEQYALESEEDDTQWEQSLEYTEAMSGTGVWTVPGSLDKAENLDSNRPDFETGQEVALRRAKYDILRSHRGTEVSFQTVFQPMLDLSHTVFVDCDYLEAKGKVVALRHTLDIDSGGATTDVTIALSRRNGTGTVADDTIAAPAEPTDPDETEPTKVLVLGFHLGGHANLSPAYNEAWEDPGAYITNYTAGTSWETSLYNPAAQAKVYDEKFVVTYPEIDSTYTNATNTPDEVVFEVNVPEDTLLITA